MTGTYCIHNEGTEETGEVVLDRKHNYQNLITLMGCSPNGDAAPELGFLSINFADMAILMLLIS